MFIKPLALSLSLLSFAVQSSETIQNVLNNELNKYIKPGEPGCSVSYGKGSQHYFASSGLKRIDQKEKLTEHTRFLTASISKQFTAHMAMILQDKGLLTLTAPLASALPDFPAAKTVNALQLMNHTSGIPDHWSVFELQGKALSDKFVQKDALTLLQEIDFLAFAPGSQFSYSNGGYALLTTLIERTTGKSINQSSKELLFTPLGIKAQYLSSADYELDSLVHGHMIDRKGNFSYNQYQSYIYGPGNLMITTNEFAIWAEYLMDYLSNSAPHGNNKFNYQSGLYLSKDDNNTTYYYHGGYYEHASQDIVLIPDTDEYAVALCNRSDFKPAHITRNILKALNALKLEKFEAKPFEHNVTLKTGFYIDNEAGKSAVLFSENEELYYYGNLVGSPKKLSQVSNNKWVAELSATNIFVEKIAADTLLISNEQSKNKVYLVSSDNKEFTENLLYTYHNELIGKVEIKLGENSYIDFQASVGKLPLTCYKNNLCIAEYGYVLLNLNDLNKPTLSTHHIQNFRLNRSNTIKLK